jgi:hypothetical protein
VQHLESIRPVWRPVMYLRKETRPHNLYGGRGDGKVVAYYRDDPETTGKLAVPVCANPWPSRPDKRNKWVMFNCFRYRAIWCDDLSPSPSQDLKP